MQVILDNIGCWVWFDNAMTQSNRQSPNIDTNWSASVLIEHFMANIGQKKNITLCYQLGLIVVCAGCIGQHWEFSEIGWLHVSNRQRLNIDSNWSASVLTKHCKAVHSQKEEQYHALAIRVDCCVCRLYWTTLGVGCDSTSMQHIEKIPNIDTIWPTNILTDHFNTVHIQEEEQYPLLAT